MDPLEELGRALAAGTPAALLAADGSETHEPQRAAYIRLGARIWPRDAPTGYRARRGTGDAYGLDAVWLLLEKHRASSYGDYITDARKAGVPVVSLVDRKDLAAYVAALGEGTRPECAFVDRDAPRPQSYGSFEELSAPGESKADARPERADESAPAQASGGGLRLLDAAFPRIAREDAKHTAAPCDLSPIAEMARAALLALSAPEESQPSSSKSAKGPLVEQVARANTAQQPRLEEAIVIVPARAPNALITADNVGAFLSRGVLVPYAEASPEPVEHRYPGTAAPVRLRVVDNGARLALSDWPRVVAVFVSGAAWQFRGWRWETPAELLRHVRGFHVSYGDGAGVDPSWNVASLHVGRTRRNLDAPASCQFWAAVEPLLRARGYIRQ